MKQILEIKFRMAIFGLKAICDSRDSGIFGSVFKESEFEELFQ
jgi:hypothetical protein